MGRLLEPTRLGGLEVRNRILRSATAERRADAKGYPTEAPPRFMRISPAAAPVSSSRE